jgi:drug/metabolite transporter (DMT)-like permease
VEIASTQEKTEAMVTRGTALVTIAAVSFGSVAILGKLAYALDIPLATLLTARFGIAAAILWIVVLALRTELVPKHRIPVTMALGIMLALQTAAYFTTLHVIPASLTSLLLFTFPAIVTVVDHFLGYRLTWLRGGTVAVALFGTYLVIAAPVAALSPAGVAFGLLTAVCYAAYILVASRALRGLPPLATTATMLTTSGLAFALFALVARDRPPALSTASVLVFLGLAVLSTVVPILLQNVGMPEIGSSRAAVIGTFELVTTVILAAFVLHDRVSPIQVIGGALIVASIVIREGVEQWKSVSPAAQTGIAVPDAAERPVPAT